MAASLREIETDIRIKELNKSSIWFAFSTLKWFTCKCIQWSPSQCPGSQGSSTLVQFCFCQVSRFHLGNLGKCFHWSQEEWGSLISCSLTKPWSKALGSAFLAVANAKANPPNRPKPPAKVKNAPALTRYFNCSVLFGWLLGWSSGGIMLPPRHGCLAFQNLNFLYVSRLKGLLTFITWTKIKTFESCLIV